MRARSKDIGDCIGNNQLVIDPNADAASGRLIQGFDIIPGIGGEGVRDLYVRAGEGIAEDFVDFNALVV
jgi:hypothetical protein